MSPIAVNSLRRGEPILPVTAAPMCSPIPTLSGQASIGRDRFESKCPVDGAQIDCPARPTYGRHSNRSTTTQYPLADIPVERNDYAFAIVQPDADLTACACTSGHCVAPPYPFLRSTIVKAAAVYG